MEFAAITMSFGLLVINGVMALTARMIVKGALPLNAEIGLRTKATKATEDAWVAGHQAARPALTAGWPIGVGLAAMTILLGVFADEHWVVAVFGGSAYLVVISILLVAVHRANQAARAV